MGSKTNIEWADSTWNPVTGCTPKSVGCQNCYAKSLARRFPAIHGDPDFCKIVVHQDRMQQPYSWRKRKKVFVCSMGDLFHPDVPDQLICNVSRETIACLRHTFFILTKRPKNMAAWVAHWHRSGVYGFLNNTWFGVTAENQAMFEKRWPILRDIKPVYGRRFISFEPLLSPVDVMPLFRNALLPDWVIVGAETGSGARPMDLAWARDIRDACNTLNIPFFFKKAGRNITTPDDLNIHQFPDMKRV